MHLVVYLFARSIRYCLEGLRVGYIRLLLVS
jgi:hypothetical protein